MKHLLLNQTIPSDADYTVVAFNEEEGKVSVKSGTATPLVVPTKVWYEDGSYKEFYIVEILEGKESPMGVPFPERTKQIDDLYLATKIEISSDFDSIGYGAFGSCNKLTSVVIPNSITSIGKSVFASCKKLTNVELPNNLQMIDDYLFVGCSGLTSVTIPYTVTRIGNQALSNCSALTSIDYNGTIEEWNLITKATTWKLDTPSCTVHCTNGDIII